MAKEHIATAENPGAPKATTPARPRRRRTTALPPRPVPPPATLWGVGLAGAGAWLALAGLLAAIVAALTPPLYALGWAIFTQRVRRHDLRRALRQAALLALGIVACLGMGLFSLFNGLNALLLFVVLALAEFFFLSRS